MFSDSQRPGEDLVIGGSSVEAPLGRARRDDGTVEVTQEVAGETMDGVTFRHRRSDAGRAGASRS